MTLNNAYLNYFSVSHGNLPTSVEESQDLGLLVSNVAALKDGGFSKHFRSAPSQSAYDLAHAAVQKLEPYLKDVSHLLYATCLPLNGNKGNIDTFSTHRDVKVFMDFPASHLQTQFNLRNALVYGISQQACTSLLGAFKIAQMFIQTDPQAKQILCLTADRFPQGALYEQAYNLISDGAAAVIISAEPRGYRILECHGITNGALAQASDDETVGTYFNYSFRVIKETLERAKLAASDLDWIVPQNTNIQAWNVLSKLLGISSEKVFCATLPEIGHMISGDNIANLIELEKSGRARIGDRVLFLMAGYGLNWHCVILEKVS